MLSRLSLAAAAAASSRAQDDELAYQWAAEKGLNTTPTTSKNWLKFSQEDFRLAIPPSPRFYEYVHLHMCQCNYMVGEGRIARLFPDSDPKERWIWSRYHKVMADEAVGTRRWTAAGTVFTWDRFQHAGQPYHPSARHKGRCPFTGACGEA
ncbi:MAG: hypothetical protein RMJ52_15210 [Gemmataceae bacterium]|nr:hypothetical protein [Gemmataceae bacterium]